MFGRLFKRKAFKPERIIRYGRPLDPDITGMETVETRKGLFPYCAEEMVRYSAKPGLCDCCGRNVDQYVICEPAWDGWESYRKRQVATENNLATDSDKNFELHLCTECLASGKGAEKFRVRYFNLPRHVSDEWQLQGYEEVMLRTPDHISCVNADSKCIPHHCDEVCRLVARFEHGEEIPAELVGKILPYSDDEFHSYGEEDFASTYEKAVQTFLFRCRRCGQYMAVFYDAP